MDKNVRTGRKTDRSGLPFFSWLAISAFALFCTPAFAADLSPDVSAPIATDSRIKTFIYSENDVFNIVTHYGYQCNVEFGMNEEIQTISIGDRVPFQVIPAGRRLFIRAMTVNARTNMTVVTDKHAYQFDLASVPAPVMPNEELVYVVRFFYPSDKKNLLTARGGENVSVANTNKMMYNYKYTYTGSDEIAPLKIYDDGKSTYFKLRSSSVGIPTIFAMDGVGREVSLSSHSSGEYLVVDEISPRFTIRAGDYMVMVYNEKLSDR